MITPDPGDRLIEELALAEHRLQAHVFPRLEVIEPDPDRETEPEEGSEEAEWDFPHLRCPRCGEDLGDKDLVAVDSAGLRESGSDDINAYSGQVRFVGDGPVEWGETLYYLHNGHAVSLPERWAEDWT